MIKQQFDSFEELLTASDTPLLVDFYATWCGPCHLMAKILEEVKTQMQDQLRVAKIDTEKYPQLASQFEITALPTLILFKNGQPVDRIEGVLQTEKLVHRLQGLL